MVIEIRRRWLSLSLSGDQMDYETVVWREDGPPFATPINLREDAPPGYAAGLLSVFIDGQPVTFERMWAVIAEES